ncbi:MAG: ABC transporter permease [Christensenellaceae bacterium]|jgi:NitT/TauT family transport system permease protein|nr:ABC transporter permease [Christensenellaceae bacterium]
MKQVEKYSDGYLKFRKRQITQKWLVRAAQFSIFAVLIILWEVLTKYQVIDSFFISSPSRIIKAIGELSASGELFGHIGATLYETLAGFAISVGLGTIIAILLWTSSTVKRILEPYLVLLNALPKIALGPVIIILAATQTAAIITMCVLICVITTIISLLSSFINADAEHITLLKSMNANKAQIFTKYVFPSSIPNFISVLKVNIGLCWVGSIMGEYLTSTRGLGYLILYGSQVFKLDYVMASVVIIAILATFMYVLISFVEKRVHKL